MNELTKKHTNTLRVAMIGMLCALAYIAVAVCRIPVVLFLKYEPKDVIIALGGLSLGPAAAALISFIVSFIEMVTISDNGVVGLLMNIIATCAFSCTAAIIYKKKHNFAGAVIGLCVGWLLMIAAMMFWNWIITPFYLDIPRSAVVKLLVPAILPFNFIKGGINTALTLLIYKPLMVALRRAHLPLFTDADPIGSLSADTGLKSFRFKSLFVALPILLVCVTLMIWMMTNS